MTVCPADFKNGLACGARCVQGTVCNALGAAMVFFGWEGGEDETVGRVGEGWHVEPAGEYFEMLSLCI